MVSRGKECNRCVVAQKMHRKSPATGIIHKAKRSGREGTYPILNTRVKIGRIRNLLPLREKLAEFADWGIPATPNLND
jgi:hypothetical protein